MAGGFNRMNNLVVQQAAQGLVTYLLQVNPHVKQMGVAVGYDGRYNSETFALITALTFIARGVKVYLHSTLVATPVLAFSVLYLKTAAGVMVTASHNPKEDNGYKVYWENGCQISSPHDKGISDCINANLAPWCDYRDQLSTVRSHALCINPTVEVRAQYLAAITAAVCRHHATNPSAPINITYTAMHGVGYPFAKAAFESAALPHFVSVTEQQEADPDFPTVVFPNPQEGRGALALAIKTANAHNSTFIIANDPDADRMAAAEKLPSGEWHIFKGNELGILLAAWQWRCWREAHPDAAAANVAMLASTVSSKMLKAMATHEGFHYEETLTGFKWLSAAALGLQQSGYTVLFAYEEAIGYMVGTQVLDKDGVSAAVAMAELVNTLAREGKTCLQYLQSLFDRYGVFAQCDSYFLCYEPPVVDRIFARIRSLYTTQSVGQFRIKAIRDLTTGYDSNYADNKARFPTSKSSHMITFTFENGANVTLRTSGTEPKLKYYAEHNGAPRDKVERELADVVQAIIEVYLQPKENNLTPPPS
eukprot:TRINITY_DN13530_c0_g1_i1.p1 TRINITY_DN13530_c0_g1~~TRINITY_DN13530_c0_g1_i1.p1  ORF type:complete len:608 (-),score=163.63 TRINITY_DN13530_c0_g1_i1:33-1637(-)